MDRHAGGWMAGTVCACNKEEEGKRQDDLTRERKTLRDGPTSLNGVTYQYRHQIK